MSKFAELCKVIEDMDPKDYVGLFSEVSHDVITALIELDGKENALDLYFSLIMASVGADGVLDSSEYALVKPVMDVEFGGDSTYEWAVQRFHDSGVDTEEFRDTVDRIVDDIGVTSPKLKSDMAMLCLLVCAVDGIVSEDERQWIRKLIL